MKNITIYILLMFACISNAQTTFINYNKVNLRGKSNTKSKVIEQLHYGTKVVIKRKVTTSEPVLIEGKMYDWYLIEIDSKYKQTGFVAGKYLQTITPFTPSKYRLLYVDTEALNFRPAPSSENKRIGYLKKGDFIQFVAVTNAYETIAGETFPWIKVKHLPSKKTGFVCSKFVQMVQESDWENFEDNNLLVDVNIPTASISIDLENESIPEIELMDDVKTVEYQTSPTPLESIIAANDLTAPARVVVLNIGVSDYEDPKLEDLNYAHSDALKIARLFQNHKVITILNEAATVENVKKQLIKILATTNPQDLVLFYFNGHGSKNKLVLTDGYLKLETIFEICNNKQPLQRKLFFIDACHSGYKSDKKDQLDINQFLDQHKYNISIFSSSDCKQASWELETFKGSLFTHYVILGLKGLADKDFDRTITYGELINYVSTSVTTYSTINLPKLQAPVTYGPIISNLPLRTLR